MVEKVIKNNYRMMDEIGRGSVATVYLAKDMARSEVVALKIIHPDLAKEGEFLRRFRREAQLLARLDTPHAVRVYDYGEDDGLNFIVLEYVQGETLASILDKEGPLEVERALDLAKQVAGCLVDAHEKGIVHRDIRPANVMLTAEGMVKVMDFGIAQGADLSRLAASGVLGSPHYLSPEQAEGEVVDIRSDIYSLGVTLFEMLTGQRPYEGESAGDIVTKHLKEPVPSARTLKEDIPPEVDALVAKCMAKDPARRYQMPPDLIRAIDDILQSMGAHVSPSIGFEAALTGQTLGQYRLLEQVGRGGMATVYRGYQPALERYVAIKILPTYLAHEPNFAARFEREAKSAARLNHPHILPVYDFGREGELNYIVMRYVEAGTLKEMLGEPLELERAVELTAQIGAALDYAHRHGVVHRDVKPANVLMDEEGWPLLSDFGLARMMEASVQLTKTGVGVGTPAYMSPEQGQGLAVDGRTDVYSLGVVLYEMLTGRVPFEAETPMAVVLKHITAPLPLPRQVNPSIPEAVERVILRALAKDPDDRYPTVGEMVAALREAVVWADVGEAIGFEVGEEATPPIEAAPMPEARQTGEKVPPAPAEVARPERHIRWKKTLGKIVREAIGTIFFVALTVGAVFWAMRNPEVLQSILAKVQQVLPGQSRVAKQADAFAAPILAAVAKREPDYSDDFGDPTSGWPVQSNVRQETKYEEGMYSVLIKAADTGSGLFMDELGRFDDFVAQVDVRWVSDAWRGNVGFLWRFERGDPCYGGWISPASKRWGMWNRGKTMDIGGGSGHIQGKQEWNRLTLVVKGEDIALYVNDEPVAFANDDECHTGGVQLNVHAGESGVRVHLDNLKVWDLSGLGLPGETPAATRPPSPADQAHAFADPILQAITDRDSDYGEDFSDPGSGWPSGSTADGDKWGYEDDAYLILATYLPQGECCIGVRPDLAPWFSDFVLEVDAHVVSGGRGAWFVVFRDSAQAHYGVSFRPDGTLGIWRNVGGAHAQLVETDAGTPAFRRGAETNHLTIVARGPRIAVYVNGEPLWFVHDESSSEGAFALGVENQTDKATLEVHFDDIEVWDISDLVLPGEMPPPTGTPTLADRAREFAEPILAEIASRQPDYVDGFGDPASGWAFADSGGQGRYEDGRLCLDCLDGCGPQASPVFADFVLEVDVERTETAARSAPAVVTFRATDRFYGLAISPNGGFQLERFEPSARTTVTLIKGVSLATNRGNNHNHVQVIVRGSDIAFYINDEPVGFAHDDDALQPGMLGLGLHGPGIAYFDDLWVWDISARASAVVTVDALNIRAGPGADYDFVGVVRKDDELDVVARTPAGDWFKVRAPDGTEGWVAAAYIALNVALDEIPEVEFASTPAPTPGLTAVPAETPTSSPSAETGSATGCILWDEEPFAGVGVKLCTDWSMIGGCKGDEYTAVSDSDGRYTITGLPPGTYRVATQVPGQENETGWMGVKVEVQSGETTPVKDISVFKYDLELLSPGEEETIETATPILTWARYSYAAYYKVYLAPYGGGEAVVQFERTTNTTYTVSSPLQPGKFYWSVRAHNDRGTLLAESSGHFTLAGD
jgi:serine/threonine protein kinase